MLETLGYSDMAAFIADVVPEDILDAHPRAPSLVWTLWASIMATLLLLMHPPE